jgi:RimJ/RimL family protein N-acetyltransferase
MLSTDYNLQPETLQNTLIKLVPFQESDTEQLYKVASDPKIWENHPSKTRYQREEFQLFLDSAVTSKSAFLVYDIATNVLIGSTRFYNLDTINSTIAIGYTFLAKKYWGGGHNKAMKKLLIDYAFQYVDTILFHIGETNIISQKAIAKIGATKKGIVDFNNSEMPYFEYELQKKDWV